jgi:hypothetical protein
MHFQQTVLLFSIRHSFLYYLHFEEILHYLNIELILNVTLLQKDINI